MRQTASSNSNDLTKYRSVVLERIVVATQDVVCDAAKMEAPRPRNEVERAWNFLQLLGQRSSARSRRRVVVPRKSVRLARRTLLDRFVEYVCPWNVSEYPGPYRLIAELCRVSGSGASIRRWRREPDKMPAYQAMRLARYLEERVAGEVALIRDLEAYALKHEAEKRLPYLSRMTTTERRRIAAQRRAEREASKRLGEG